MVLGTLVSPKPNHVTALFLPSPEGGRSSTSTSPSSLQNVLPEHILSVSWRNYPSKNFCSKPWFLLQTIDFDKNKLHTRQSLQAPKLAQFFVSNLSGTSPHQNFGHRQHQWQP